MTHDEALRMLGLKQGASPEEIKTAYREMAQILHPDKFPDNKKLKSRAEEQLKQVNMARDILLGNSRASRTGSSRRASSAWAKQAAEPYDPNDAAALKARLNGIAAARIQLVAVRDNEQDSRKLGLLLFAGGLILTWFIGRRFAPVAALSGTAVIWGLIQLFTSQSHISQIDKRLKELELERKSIEDKLAKM